MTRSTESADTIAADYEVTLSKDYGTVDMETVTLDHAGECALISASNAKNSKMAHTLQTIYIIPATEGCIVAAVHCTTESAEGFGTRFSSTVNTLSVIE